MVSVCNHQCSYALLDLGIPGQKEAICQKASDTSCHQLFVNALCDMSWMRCSQSQVFQVLIDTHPKNSDLIAQVNHIYQQFVSQFSMSDLFDQLFHLSNDELYWAIVQKLDIKVYYLLNRPHANTDFESVRKAITCHKNQLHTLKWLPRLPKESLLKIFSPGKTGVSLFYQSNPLTTKFLLSILQKDKDLLLEAIKPDKNGFTPLAQDPDIIHGFLTNPDWIKDLFQFYLQEPSFIQQLNIRTLAVQLLSCPDKDIAIQVMLRCKIPSFKSLFDPPFNPQMIHLISCANVSKNGFKRSFKEHPIQGLELALRCQKYVDFLVEKNRLSSLMAQALSIEGGMDLFIELSIKYPEWIGLVAQPKI